MHDDAPLWQARNIGEHAYCPRLFYYMQVEGVFLPSADTEEGTTVHRRVDKPSAIPAHSRTDADDEDDRQEPGPGDGPHTDKPRPVRSLHLTSERLRLTARLDLAEISEPSDPRGRPTAVPIEYRKGRPRRVVLASGTNDTGDDLPDEDEPGQERLHRVEPWPTDRVQVGLQVVLLEEHGYHVPHAVLYYAAEKRRVLVTIDDDLRAVALAELESAKRTAEGERPLPLVNDPKCPRCSLQPICLPDEVNHQRLAAITVDGQAVGTSAAGDEATAPRRMWPPRDDGLHVVAQREGVRVGIRGGALRFTDRDGALVREQPIAGIEALAVVGRVQVSTEALHAMADRGVPVAFMTAAGRTVAMVDPLGPVSAQSRKAQVMGMSIPARCLELARALVAAKIVNQRTLLMRNARDLPRRVADDLAEQAEKARVAASLESLLGHEGTAARHYFQWFPAMLRDEDLRARFEATGRRRRPPPDPVNAVLSFGYAMLVHECTSALRLASLDPAIGGYHQPRPGKPAMALDLMEPFRPLIADSVAISMFNRAEVGPGHFLDTAAGCAMTDHGRRAFFDAWGRRMATVVAHPVFEYRMEYRRMLMLHARLISAWLQGEAPTLAFLTTR
ncbi:MAG: CRISPR-associated endonuclease Cas1 [Phycisphaeraceae bacterium]|nr:CRISPR-associated endonuclease Cas1 [Phycisphaeraceae bacterium]